MTGQREPAVDALRTLATAGVVLGHWLVTAPGTPHPMDGTIDLDSPLRTMPALAPVSWLLQTLGLFYLVAGFAAARSQRANMGSSAQWWWRRVQRVAGPVAGLAGAVLAVIAALALTGAPQQLVFLVPLLALSPLWFLAVHLTLLAATPALVRLDARWGGWAAALPAALALTTSWCGPAAAATSVLTAWWVPWQLGIMLSRRPLSRSVAATLLAAGAAGVLCLVLVVGLPATAVGLPGAAQSNLVPPSAATVALALAQCGAAGLAWPYLSRLRGGCCTRFVSAVNRSALPVFLLHQAALVATWLLTLPIGPLPGLHDAPAGPSWLLARLGWLPVLGATLAILLAAFRHLGHGDPATDPSALPSDEVLAVKVDTEQGHRGKWAFLTMQIS